jgi:hypothetical protein
MYQESNYCIPQRPTIGITHMKSVHTPTPYSSRSDVVSSICANVRFTLLSPDLAVFVTLLLIIFIRQTQKDDIYGIRIMKKRLSQHSHTFVKKWQARVKKIAAGTSSRPGGYWNNKDHCLHFKLSTSGLKFTMAGQARYV